MGFLSLGGSKKSTSTNTTDNTTASFDAKAIDGSGNVVGGNITIGGANTVVHPGGITTTDYGALDKAGELSEMAFSQVQNSFNSVNQALNKVADFATKQTGSDQNQTVQYLIMGAALVLAIWVYRA